MSAPYLISAKGVEEKTIYIVIVTRVMRRNGSRGAMGPVQLKQNISSWSNSHDDWVTSKREILRGPALSSFRPCTQFT